SSHAGAVARIVGVVLVVVFMILFYGLFGVFADIALLFNLCLMLGSLSLLGATLTLPGIAGIALTMGMAVDANVLIYERIREEVRGGRSVLSSLGATLTLPGIAGIALTMRMAVDANVLIYERIREEVRGGRSVLSSLEAGFSRAFGTILDSHVTTFVAGVLMFALGSGPVKGFAVTLCLGVAW